MKGNTILLKTLVVMLSVMLIACLSSCHPSEEVAVDRSLLTGEPCGPPCWQGQVPGVSTEEEVLQYMADSKYVGHHYRDPFAGSNTIWWQSTLGDRSQRTWNAFGIRDGMLADMVIFLDYEFTLEELLIRYGDPERFRAQWDTGSSADAEVTLYYPRLGMIPQLELKPSDGYHELHPESKVIRVWYFPPTSLNGLFYLAGDIPFPDKREHAEIVLQDWQGYGRIELR